MAPDKGSQKGETMAYSWTVEEGLRFFGIKVNTKRTEQKIHCPWCGSDNFSMNTVHGFGKCWSCNESADVPKYGAKLNNITVAEARKQIERFYGYDSDGWKKEKHDRVVVKTPSKRESEYRAPAHVLDTVYRAFLSSLNLKSVDRYEMKARCGMDDNTLEFLNYRSYPVYEEVNYFSLCKSLLSQGYKLDGVPGFYRVHNGNGDWCFASRTPGILMPLVNINNQIVGLQLRKNDAKRVVFDNDGKLELEAKCTWFSSAGNTTGTSARSGIHYACDFKFDNAKKCFVPVFPDGGVILTEGIMKADIIHYLLPNLPVLGVQGVNAINELADELAKLKEFGVDTVKLAYDMDYKTNVHVQSALERTKETIENAGMIFQTCEWDTRIESHPEVYLKGLDDYLAYAMRQIVPKVKEISPDEQFEKEAKS